MGNFHALCAEISRRRHSRWALWALTVNWGLFGLVFMLVPGVRG